MPDANVPATLKAVRKALKELRRAADEVVRIGRKRAQRDIGAQLLAISTETRQRAQETSQIIHKAFRAVEDGSAEHAELIAVSEEFKAALRRFQQVNPRPGQGRRPCAA